MEIAAKALYNSLRISFLQNPSFSVETWKVEDYRSLALEELFLRLNKSDIIFDPATFIAYADEYDTPEELFDDLVADQEVTSEGSDQIYLILFELWRRLVPEKLSISIICDELDHQIFLYDSRKLANEEPLEDALTRFASVLIEHVDNGIAPVDAFEAISEYLANDFQAFLVDYISDLVEAKEVAHAMEQIEQFYQFMPDKKWLDLLQIRMIASQDISRGHDLLRALFHNNKQEHDVEFNLDILSFLVALPDYDIFKEVLLHSVSLIEDEDQMQELLSLAIEFFTNRSEHDAAELFQKILSKRKKAHQEGLIAQDDPDMAVLKQIRFSKK